MTETMRLILEEQGYTLPRRLFESEPPLRKARDFLQDMTGLMLAGYVLYQASQPILKAIEQNRRGKS